MESQKCLKRVCQKRHPKICVWFNKPRGCFRQECDFLHVTLAEEESPNERSEIVCAGCKNAWEDVDCFKMHIIKGTVQHFCLNCDGWIINKHEVLIKGWTLYDENGDLRRDV